jgi:hypothetical protein
MKSALKSGRLKLKVRSEMVSAMATGLSVMEGEFWGMATTREVLAAPRIVSWKRYP